MAGAGKQAPPRVQQGARSGLSILMRKLSSALAAPLPPPLCSVGLRSGRRPNNRPSVAALQLERSRRRCSLRSPTCRMTSRQLNPTTLCPTLCAPPVHASDRSTRLPFPRPPPAQTPAHAVCPRMTRAPRNPKSLPCISSVPVSACMGSPASSDASLTQASPVLCGRLASASLRMEAGSEMEPKAQPVLSWPERRPPCCPCCREGLRSPYGGTPGVGGWGGRVESGGIGAGQHDDSAVDVETD